MLPTIIKNLLIINVLVFLAQITIGKNTTFLEDTFALHTWQSPLFRPWQFITHMFMHGGWDHLFFNMFALWMFGSVLENLWGPKKFLTFYLVCGLGAALCHMGVLYFETQHFIDQYNALNPSSPTYVGDMTNFIVQNNIYNGLPSQFSNNIPGFAQFLYEQRLNEATLGASGAIFGCLAAFGFLFPNTYIYLYFFIPVKAKWFVLFYAAFELYMTIQKSAGDNVAHVAHLGGALFGIILVYYWKKNNR
ncbi:MAG: rhomboid family intramembrane serine protease [Bacteroidetes bacterium]|nr:rhomboid family intramembrane serine protease [Bacteroidota bacterium]